MTFFICRLLTTLTSRRRLSSVLSKFSHKKINFSQVSPSWRVSPGAVRHWLLVTWVVCVNHWWRGALACLHCSSFSWRRQCINSLPSWSYGSIAPPSVRRLCCRKGEVRKKDGRTT